MGRHEKKLTIKRARLLFLQKVHIVRTVAMKKRKQSPNDGSDQRRLRQMSLQSWLGKEDEPESSRSDSDPYDLQRFLDAQSAAQFGYHNTQDKTQVRFIPTPAFKAPEGTPDREAYELKRAHIEYTMAEFDSSGPNPDPHNLKRFTEAHKLKLKSKANIVINKGSYRWALKEIEDGRKQGCWMWYIFPQIKGLSTSRVGERYAIQSMEEARAYLAHPVLNERLITLTRAVLAHPRGTKMTTLMSGDVDAMKLQSCMTLFYGASSKSSELFLFHKVIKKFYGGKWCDKTTDQFSEKLWN